MSELDPLVELQVDILYKIFDRGVPTPFKDVQPGMPVSILCDHDAAGFGRPVMEDGTEVVAEIMQGTYLRREQLTGKYATLPNGEPCMTDIIDLHGSEVWVDIKEDGTGSWPTGGPVHPIKLGPVHPEYTVTSS